MITWIMDKDGNLIIAKGKHSDQYMKKLAAIDSDSFDEMKEQSIQGTDVVNFFKMINEDKVHVNDTGYAFDVGVFI